MRAAVIFGLDSSVRDLQPFRDNSDCEWITGLPASATQADAILIFGGDGTVHRHLSRLVQLQLPLLVVPCGSGNDFARALKLTNRKASLAAWQEFLSAGRNIREIDLGVITPIARSTHSTGETPAPHQHYFCCVGGVGIDAEVARRANRLPGWVRGHGGYVLSLLPALLGFEPFKAKLSLDESAKTAERVILVAFANTPAYGGGMKIAPRAEMDDGLLDVCVVSEISKSKLLSLFPSVYFGRHLGMKEVEYLQSPGLRIEAERPVEVYADGEYVCRTPIEVGVAHRVLKVIVKSSPTSV